MPNSSILGGEPPQRRAAGRDTDALGPSDSSDSGSDIQGEAPMATRADRPDELGAITADTDSDTDRSGTGERASATGDVDADADILPDRVESDPRLAHDEQGESQQIDAILADTDEFAVSDAEDDPPADPSAKRIDVDDAQSVSEWADKFDVTPDQLKEAVGVAGHRAADVEMHLKGSHSTTDADLVHDAGDSA